MTFIFDALRFKAWSEIKNFAYVKPPQCGIYLDFCTFIAYLQNNLACAVFTSFISCGSLSQIFLQLPNSKRDDISITYAI
jgi:hypothetical protein